jgi:hypothetical protein
LERQWASQVINVTLDYTPRLPASLPVAIVVV